MSRSFKVVVNKQESASLSAKAYAVIRKQILTGDLPIGTALSRRSLAAQLGMSLLPVAEALQRLESEGLVESRARVGTRVRVPTANSIRENYELREALESHSARLFNRRANTRNRSEAMCIAEHVDALFNRCFTGGKNDPEFVFAVQTCHAGLHLKIAEGGECQALAVAIEKNQVLTFNWFYDMAAHRPPLPPSFHRDLVEAISGGTEDQAEEAMRAHVQYGREYVIKTAMDAVNLQIHSIG